MSRLVVVLISAALCAAAAAPDDTSTIDCGSAATNPLSALTLCTLTVKSKGVSINSDWAFFQMQPGTADAKLSNVAPASGKSASFTFIVTVGSTTGPYMVSSGALPNVAFSYVVYDTPDETSSLVCKDMDNTNYLLVGKTANCTVVPKIKGKAIWAQSTVFVPGPASFFTFSSLSAAVGPQFHFTATAKSTSIMTAITDGFGRWNTTIYDIPDSTSILICSPPSLQVKSSLQCSIVPQTAGEIVYAKANAFNISGGNPGTTVPTISGYSNAFNDLVWKMGPLSGIYEVSDGINTNEIDIYDHADTTTNIVCGAGEDLPVSKAGYPQMGVGGTFHCDILPSKGSASNHVYTLPTDYVINCQDKNGAAMKGSYDPAGVAGKGAVTPNKVGDNFHFSFTSTEKYLNDNYLQVDTAVTKTYNVEFIPLGTPDSTSSLTCENTTITAGDTVDCELTTMSKSAPVFVAASSVKLSDGDNDGKFSSLSSKVHYKFTFTYTAGPHNRAIELSDGFGSSLNLRVVGGTDPLSAGIIVAIVAGSCVGVGAIAWFCKRRGNKDENVPLLDQA